jgi:Uncharacterised protein family (UPF0014)
MQTYRGGAQNCLDTHYRSDEVRVSIIHELSFSDNKHVTPSVIGIVAIPGMMTGAILGGTSVTQAAKLQMIIMFMLSSATTMAAVFTTIAAIAVTVDGDHRIRSDRIEGDVHAVWRAREAAVRKVIEVLKKPFSRLKREHTRVEMEPEELSPLTRIRH